MFTKPLYDLAEHPGEPWLNESKCKAKGFKGPQLKRVHIQRWLTGFETACVTGAHVYPSCGYMSTDFFSDQVCFVSLCKASMAGILKLKYNVYVHLIL